MKRFNYIILLIAIAVASYFGGYAFRLHAESMKTNNRLKRLVKTEKRLKKFLQTGKYKGYLKIKSQYAAKLLKYAEKHKNKKFVKALAEKEQAEVKYYKK